MVARLNDIDIETYKIDMKLEAYVPDINITDGYLHLPE